MNDFGKVAVLYGGDSAEREVSLKSGAEVHQALCAAGVDAYLVDTREHDAVFRLKADGFSCAFIALHGRGGEDGQIQAILDWQGVPYTGAGVLACALAMDKVLTKKLWSAYGLPVQSDMLIDAQTRYDDLVSVLGGTQFAIKPALEGSSVGISCIANQKELETAYQKAGGVAEKIMAECWVTGRELTYAVVAGEVLPSVEICASSAHKFYDYEAKYLADDTRYFCPAELSPELDAEMRRLALAAYESIGSKGWARVDFILGADGHPWLLEINMSPGMTSHSLVPVAAQAAGMSMQVLVLKVLAQAF
ncbi:MAG: D-alanine--D-alanine ligase [Cardiobacteriaceae bacterium]|nr:D-alanine--D-alanine ligase [Cardiobacteriaceae bacterium]